MKSRLSEIENSFQTRMDGKTKAGIVGSLIGTLIWIVAFGTCIVLVKNAVDNTILLIALTIVVGLFAFMLIDTIMDFSYYGKISSYKKSISQFQNRVSIGKKSIMSNQDAFMSSRSQGWNYLLNAAPSIPDEAASVEDTMINMESLKKGVVNGAKNFFFFATVIAITVVGCVALFPIGSGIITGITGESFTNDTLMIFNIIALIIAGFGEVILAKFVWSETDCNVTNVTLLITPLGPVAFLALIAAVTLIVMLVVMIVSVILALLAIVVGVGFLIASVSGG